MLCLFVGTLTRLDVRQRPEAMHLAVELPAAAGQFGKSLRNADGTDGPVLASLPLGPGGRLPIGDLTRSIAATLRVETLGSGDFARQKIETAEQVSFLSSCPLPSPYALPRLLPFPWPRGPTRPDRRPERGARVPHVPARAHASPRTRGKTPANPETGAPT